MNRFLPALLCAALLVLPGCALFSSEAAEESAPIHEVDHDDAPPPTVDGSLPPDEQAQELFAKAHILWKGGDVCTDPALAVYLLDQAIALKPDYADAYMRRGLAHSEMGLDEEAFADLSRAIRLDARADRYAYRALGFIREGNLAGARKDVERSLELDTRQYRAWNYSAVIHMMNDNAAAACADFVTGCKNGDCSGLEAAKSEGMCR